jgi:hypothetical protein
MLSGQGPLRFAQLLAKEIKSFFCISFNAKLVEVSLQCIPQTVFAAEAPVSDSYKRF